jgi:tRNA(Ile)-lysidine synthase TilS/MesJ
MRNIKLSIERNRTKKKLLKILSRKWRHSWHTQTHFQKKHQIAEAFCRFGHGKYVAKNCEMTCVFPGHFRIWLEFFHKFKSPKIQQITRFLKMLQKCNFISKFIYFNLISWKQIRHYSANTCDFWIIDRFFAIFFVILHDK